MRVLVAGGTGVIGRPFVALARQAGHDVVLMVRSEERARETEGETVVADAFDAAAVHDAVTAARPEVVVHQLTALPQDFDPQAMAAGLELTARLRRDTMPVFVEAARAAGARRIVAQSISFVTPPTGPEVQDESAPIWVECPDSNLGGSIRAVADMERTLTGAEGVEAVVLRYGFFYGTGTWYAPDGPAGELLRARRMPLIGRSRGLWSFVHVDDAAQATLLALDRGAPGIYNVTDPAPVAWGEWIPAAARAMGAGRPLWVPPLVARKVAGAALTHYATGLRGASSAKAREQLGWQPRTWREGFADVFG